MRKKAKRTETWLEDVDEILAEMEKDVRPILEALNKEAVSFLAFDVPGLGVGIDFLGLPDNEEEPEP